MTGFCNGIQKMQHAHPDHLLLLRFWGMWGYVVTREAADRMMRTLLWPCEMPIDMLFSQVRPDTML